MSASLLQPGSLMPALQARTAHALACGAMEPIETVGEIVHDGGVDFIVRRLASLIRKERAKADRAAAPRPGNPFLPHEPDLFVADLSATHFALLNKYNVIAHHLLIVTRAFVDQEMLIDDADFFALAACMREMDGLAIYNGGPVAGASQPHKHLQLVPLPLVNGGPVPSLPAVPMESLFAPLAGRTGMLQVPGLGFRHAFAWLDSGAWDDAEAAAQAMLRTYRDMLQATGLAPARDDGRQAGPYNLLATCRWMLLVPRSRDLYDSVSVNALGYAGSLFVRDEAQMAVLKAAGPMAVLQAVGLPDLK